MNLTETSKVAPAEALDTITPASAVRVIPNEADTSPSPHPCGESSDFRLLATDSEPASIAPLMSSARSVSSSARFFPKVISRSRGQVYVDDLHPHPLWIRLGHHGSPPHPESALQARPASKHP